MKKILFLLLIPIWVFSFPSFSAPLDVKPDPPVSDPVLPTEKDPFFKDSSDFIAHSPAWADRMVIWNLLLSDVTLCALSFFFSLGFLGFSRKGLRDGDDL
ncbi:UNVERIFIED_CONTAM: hypothetical protein Sindi_0391900 [Sesamum indicum]